MSDNYINYAQNQTGRFSYGQLVWFTGVVVDINDPLMSGRVKVEIDGYYTGIDKKALMWAMPQMPITNASAGVGASPTGIDIGTRVMGYFADGELAQNPVYMGVYYSKPLSNVPSSKIGKQEYDTHGNAQEKDKLPAKTRYKGKRPKGGSDFEEPKTRFNAKYPDNHTLMTKNGHYREMDDSKGNERLRYRHPSNTEYEIDNQGTIVIHGVKDSWHMVDGDIYINTNKDMWISVKGSHYMRVLGNSTQEIDGNLDLHVKGNMDVKVDGSFTQTVGGSHTSTTGGNETRKAATINLN
jgi:gp5|nr:MAG TPA: baseplate protein [Caudoviricetes sp.]